MNLVKAMGGDITVKSEYGIGSAFTVTLPQIIHNHDRLAVVEDRDKKSVIYYERREKYAESLFKTIINLGVHCEIATDVSTVQEMAEKDSFSYVFIANGLFDKNKDVLLSLFKPSQIVLLTEFGESVSTGDWSIIPLPAHAMSVANLYNGITESYPYGANKQFSTRFTAPDAKVLIVDDINTNLKVAFGLLLPYEMEVDLVESGKEAINAVKRKNYDIVFMDHRMPEMDGVEATHHIRALGDETPSFKTLPIVALTANTVSGMKEMFLQKGFSDFISKPIDTNHLNSILEKWTPKEKQINSISNKTRKKSSKSNNLVTLKINGLDTIKGINLTGGTVEYYFETLATFYGDGQERTNKVKECLEAGDLALFGIHVHALKSASANIGADELSKLAYDLELAAQKEDIEYINANCGHFLDVMDKLLININDAIKTHSKTTGDKDGFDFAGFMHELKVLKKAHEDMDGDVINATIASLLNYRCEDNVKAVIRNISSHLLMVEYDEAAALIDMLIEGDVLSPL